MMALCMHTAFLILLHVAAYQNQKSELVAFGLCFSLISYLYVLTTKKNMRFQVSTLILSFAKKNKSKQKKYGLVLVHVAGWVFFLKNVQIVDTDGFHNTLILQVSHDHNSDQQQPTLQMVSDFLNSITLALERVAEEKYMLLNKVLMFLIFIFTNLLETDFLLNIEVCNKLSGKLNLEYRSRVP